jgi:hypothetical protein
MKQKIVNFVKTFGLRAGSLFLPLTAFAQTPPAPIKTVQELINLMCKIFGWMFYGLIALAIIMGVVAAFNYVTSDGSAEKVSKANKMLLYAAIGVAVALLAKGLPNIVASFLDPTLNLPASC